MPVLTAIDVDHAPERPITVGYDLAAAYDDTLVVTYVMPEKEYEQWQSGRDEIPEGFRGPNTISQAKKAVVRHVTDAVDDALGEYDRDRVEMRGSVGSPTDGILTAINEPTPRYVVVDGRKRSPVTQSIFGSVSHAIMRNADRSVATITEETD